MKRNLLYIITILCTSVFSAQAQETIFTDRPNVTDAVALIPQGTLQIEAGYFSDLFDNNGTDTYFITAPNLNIKYGLNEYVELRVLNNYNIIASENDSVEVNGLSPITFSPKFKIIDQNFFIPAISLATPVTFANTGKEAFQTEKVNYGFRLLLEHVFNDKYSWAHGFGADWDDTRETIWAYSSAFSMKLSGNLSAFGEFYGRFATDFMPIHGFDAGLTYLISNNLQADIVAGIPLNPNAPDFSYGFGLAWMTNLH